mgnify:CR=1 FL=1
MEQQPTKGAPPDQPQPEKEKKLTKHEKLFVEAYCTTCRGNASAAARWAGYSEKSAAIIGYENLRKPYIAKAVSQRFDELGMTTGEAVSLLTDFARDGLAPFLFPDEGGQLKVNLTNPKAEGKLGHLKKIKQYTTVTTGENFVTEKTTVEIEVVDPLAAIAKILEAHGKLVSRTDITSGGKPLPAANVLVYLPDNSRDKPTNP